MNNAMPILVLEKYIAECSSRISPTKATALGDFSESNGISIEFTDDVKFSIRVNLATNTIKLPIGSLNYLWCATHFFISLYKAYVAAQESGNIIFDTGSDDATNTAISLFNWARRDLIEGSLIWPADAPKPTLSHEPGDLIHLTNEVFLASLAWILHHERAHIELAHQGNSKGPESVRQELDADRSASQWVMANCDDILERQKRAFGIATGLMAMALVDPPSLKIPEVTSHPPDMERLLANLDYAKLDLENIVYAYSFVVLQFCIGQYDLAQTEVKSDDKQTTQTFESMFRELALRYHTRHRE